IIGVVAIAQHPGGKSEVRVLVPSHQVRVRIHIATKYLPDDRAVAELVHVTWTTRCGLRVTRGRVSHSLRDGFVAIPVSLTTSRVMITPQQPAWLRGPIEGIPSLLQPVA